MNDRSSNQSMWLHTVKSGVRWHLTYGSADPLDLFIVGLMSAPPPVLFFSLALTARTPTTAKRPSGISATAYNTAAAHSKFSCGKHAVRPESFGRCGRSNVTTVSRSPPFHTTRIPYFSTTYRTLPNWWFNDVLSQQGFHLRTFLHDIIDYEW